MFCSEFSTKGKSSKFVFFSPVKNEIYFQFVAKLWQLCVKFCKDFSLGTMGLETCLCHTHEHHRHHLVLPEYPPETNRFLTVFRLTGSNISVIVIKIFGWIYILHNRKKAQSGSRVVLQIVGANCAELCGKWSDCNSLWPLIMPHISPGFTTSCWPFGYR